MSLERSSGYWVTLCSSIAGTYFSLFPKICIAYIVVIQTYRFVVWWNDFDSWLKVSAKAANARNKFELSKKALVFQSLPYTVINTVASVITSLQWFITCSRDFYDMKRSSVWMTGFDDPRASWWLGNETLLKDIPGKTAGRSDIFIFLSRSPRKTFCFSVPKISTQITAISASPII